MCFSAKASFLSATLLAGIGLVNLRQVRDKSHLFLAAMPFIFAVQQFSEGLLWQSLGANTLLALGAKYVYLFLALVLWPVWMALATFVIEPPSWRKMAIGVLLLVGLAIAVFNVFYLLTHPVNVSLKISSLAYSFDLSWQKIPYLVVAILPGFLSSFKNLWQYSVLLLGGVVIAYWGFYYADLSVWCFFSALSSVWLYKLFNENLDRSSQNP